MPSSAGRVTKNAYGIAPRDRAAAQDEEAVVVAGGRRWQSRSRRRAGAPGRPGRARSARALRATRRCSPTAGEPRPSTSPSRRPRRSRRASAARVTAPRLALRSPNESALGVVKIRGSSARGMSMTPPPSRRTDASVVLAVSAQAGPAVETSAERTWGVVQPGWRCRRSAAAPATCGADMLVPSNGANGALANSGSVEERISPPGRRDVRLQQVAERGRPGRGEEHDRSAPARVKLVLGEREADCRAAADRDEEVPQPGAVEVGDRARRDVERGATWARPAGCRRGSCPTAPAEQRADLLRDDRAAAAEDEGDRPADRAARKRRVQRVRVRDAAELAVDRAARPCRGPSRCRRPSGRACPSRGKPVPAASFGTACRAAPRAPVRPAPSPTV